MAYIKSVRGKKQRKQGEGGIEKFHVKLLRILSKPQSKSHKAPSEYIHIRIHTHTEYIHRILKSEYIQRMLNFFAILNLQTDMK